MRILHVLAQLPTRTGSGVYYSNMVEEFKKYNHDQRAIFAYQDDFKWNTLDEEHQYAVEFKSEEVPFPIVGMSDVMPYDNTLYSNMTDEMMALWKKAFRKRLERAREEFDPDLIFAHHLWILTSMTRDVFPDKKVIGICHNTDLRQARINPHIKEEHVKNIHRLDYVFSISEEQKDEIVEIYGLDRDKIINVGGGYNQNIFYPPEEKTYADKIRLAFCGKIDPSKGVYELIEAYKSLGLEDVTLDIIGTPIGENKEKIKRYIGDDTSIRVYNVKNQVALGEEFRKKDIFILPSYYEGLGLVAIEALACGLYVVVTEIEALRSLLGDEINKSGVIKYVKAPRIYYTDKPVKEDLPAFKERLKEAILEQINKVRERKDYHRDVEDKIRALSWEGLVERMNNFIHSI